MLVLGLLSKRLGAVTHTPRYYRVLYGTTVLMLMSALGRLVNIVRVVDPAQLNDNPFWVLVYIGLPALSVTIAVIVAWRYWSWLLAERG